MVGILKLDENCQKDSLVVLVTREQNCREFIQVTSPRDLVMAEFDFCADDSIHPLYSFPRTVLGDRPVSSIALLRSSTRCFAMS